jgi:hypothetical protein
MNCSRGEPGNAGGPVVKDTEVCSALLYRTRAVHSDSQVSAFCGDT